MDRSKQQSITIFEIDNILKFTIKIEEGFSQKTATCTLNIDNGDYAFTSHFVKLVNSTSPNTGLLVNLTVAFFEKPHRCH